MSQAVPVSDLELQQLAAEPRTDLFRILKFTPVINPWLAVLAFLPGMAGVLTWTISDQSALWGLRALSWTKDFAGPTVTDLSALRGAPPLSTWLTAGVMSLVGARPPLALMLVSYLSVATTVIFVARLGRRFGSSRLGFIAALLLALDPLILNGAHTCGPELLGLCFLTISFERFLAHLDGTPNVWSGRLLVSALAWGCAWLAEGWQSFALGFAIGMVAFLIPLRLPPYDPDNHAVVALHVARRRLRKSFLIWFAIGIAAGGWWIAATIYQLGLSATWEWILQSAPNAISPLYPHVDLIRRQGVEAGHAFLTGWAVLGVIALIRHRAQLLPNFPELRAVMIMIFSMRLLVWRIMLASDQQDPTPCDLMMTTPLCLLAGFGMEALIRRIIRPVELIIAMLVGLVNILQALPYAETAEVRLMYGLGAVVCLLPVAVNFAQTRGWRWNESQRRLALRGLILATWICHGGWGVLQSRATSPSERHLAMQLEHISRSLSDPDAVLVVSRVGLPPTLEFQLRARWPLTPVLHADRWDAALASGALPESLNTILSMELNRRGTPAAVLEAGWDITSGGEPFRFLGFQLTSYHVRRKAGADRSAASPTR